MLRGSRVLVRKMTTIPFEQLESDADRAEWLRQKANWIRLSAMTMTNHSKLGHTGGDLSAADILATLYLGQVLQVDPSNPQWAKRDRFVMSKGHCSGASYSTLPKGGFFPLGRWRISM